MIRLFVYAAMAYLLVLILVWAFQQRLLFLPSMPGRELTATPQDRGWPYKSLRLTTADDVTIHGWWLPQARPRAALLFFHGNAGNIAHRLESLAVFRELGLSVLIVDYRGYGRSEGAPSEAGMRKDARAAWRYLTEARGIDTGRIVIFGRSLGAAVAAELAREHAPGAVILESAFRSLPDIAQEVYPFLPARWLARYDYATEDYVRSIGAPVLVIHSEQDEIIPYRHGRAVFNAANEPKQLLTLEGGHNTGFLQSRAAYLEGLDRFLTEAGLPKPR